MSSANCNYPHFRGRFPGGAYNRGFYNGMLMTATSSPELAQNTFAGKMPSLQGVIPY